MTVKLVRCGTGNYRIDGVLDSRGRTYFARRYRTGGGKHGYRWSVENSIGSQVEDCENLEEVKKVMSVDHAT